MNKFQNRTLSKPDLGLTQPSLSSLAPIQQLSRTQNIPLSLLDMDSYQTQTSSLPGSQKVMLSPASLPEELDSFRVHHSVLLHFAGTAPDDCRGYLGVALSRDEISARQLGALTSDCLPLEGNTWKFSVKAKNDADWNWIEPNLQGVTIYVSNDPQMTVSTVDAPPQSVAASAAPAPQPSPLPPPSPTAPAQP